MDNILPIENKYKSSFLPANKTSTKTLTGVAELQKTAELLDSLKECIKEMNSSSNILYHTANESIQGLKTQCNILNTDKITTLFDVTEISSKDPIVLLKGLQSMVEYMGVAAIHFAEETNSLNNDIFFIDSHWKGLDKYVDSYDDLDRLLEINSTNQVVASASAPLTPPASPSKDLEDADILPKKSAVSKAKSSQSKSTAIKRK